MPEIILSTTNWDEVLRELHGTVGFYGKSENGFLYSEIMDNGCINPCPKKVVEYIISK